MQHLHVLKAVSSYLGITSYLSQSEVKVCWEVGGGEERAIEARRNPTPTPHCSHSLLPPHSEKHVSAPESWKTKVSKRSTLWDSVSPEDRGFCNWKQDENKKTFTKY